MNRTSLHRAPDRGFSLIELLAVTGVVGLLLGLLVPALCSAREASRSAACASNLRQLQLANAAYANDHAGALAPGAARFARNLDRWFGTRQSTREPFEPRGGPLSPFLGPDGAVRRCPSFRPGPVVPGLDFEAGCGGYGYNSSFLGVNDDGSDEVGVRLSSIRMPTETVMFTDAAFALPSPTLRLIEYSFAESPLQRGSAYPLDPSIHFRHARSAGVGWADGHVSRTSLEFTRANIFGVTESHMRDLGLGWFGPASNRYFDLQ